MDKTKFETRLNAMAKLLEAMGDELTAMRAVLDGEQTPAQDAKAVVTTFCRVWGLRYKGHTYVPVWAKDMAQAKRLLKDLTADDLFTRIGQYVKSDDPFYRNARHPFGMFVVNVNKFPGSIPAGGNDEFLTSAPADCQHVPACRTDREHTARKVRERAEPAF